LAEIYIKMAKDLKRGRRTDFLSSLLCNAPAILAASSQKFAAPAGASARFIGLQYAAAQTIRRRKRG
jgi:hypothetical protein